MGDSSPPLACNFLPSPTRLDSTRGLGRCAPTHTAAAAASAAPIIRDPHSRSSFDPFALQLPAFGNRSITHNTWRERSAKRMQSASSDRPVAASRQSSHAANATAAAATTQSPQLTAASSSEPKSDPPKRCAGCQTERPASQFSGAQLKRGGKRLCHSCIASKRAADEAAAAPVRCMSCGKSFRSSRNRCDECSIRYCSGGCLQRHRAVRPSLCEVIRSVPPLTIPPDEVLTLEEVAREWPAIVSVRLHTTARESSGPTSGVRQRSGLAHSA